MSQKTMSFSSVVRSTVLIVLILECFGSLAAPPAQNPNNGRFANPHGNNGRHNGNNNGRHNGNGSGNGRYNGNNNSNGGLPGNGINNNNGRQGDHWTVLDWNEYIENLLQNLAASSLEGSPPREPGQLPQSVPTREEWLKPWQGSVQETCGYPGVTPDLRSQDLRIATRPDDTHSHAQLGNYPWMVSLKWSVSRSHWCGGVLISDQWVVTAAHCLFSVPPYTWGERYWTARLGVLNISSTVEDSEQVFALEEILVHPLFDRHMVVPRDSVGTPSDHDIALVKLSARATITPFVRPLCLPSPDDIPPGGTRCVITGWGYPAADSQNLSDTLKQGIVPLMDYERCMALDGYDKLLTPNVICAGYVQGGVDACRFDSGGPLQCQDGNQWKLVGVVSWGDKNGGRCAQPLRPGVYTRVDAHVTWIQETLYRDFAGLPQISWDQILPNPLKNPRAYQKR